MCLVWHLTLTFLNGVGLGRKPCYALFVPENGQRMARGDQNIQSQVKLQPVKQVWIRNVPLHDIVHGLVIFGSVLWIKLQCVSQLLHIVDKEYSFALAGLAGFDDHDGV